MDSQASPVNGRVEWYHPGEVVIVARVRQGTLDERRVHARLREHFAKEIPSDPGSLRSFTFDAPGQPMSLVFFIQQLADAGAAVSVKDVVDALHGRLDDLSTDNMEVVTAMPHCHVKAHESAFGGSPGSVPVPVPTRTVSGRPAYRQYVPRAESLRASAAANPIRVAVLDTSWDYASTRRRAERFREAHNNQQLIGTLDALRDSIQDIGTAYQSEWDNVRQCHARMGVAAAEPGAYPMPDHGLFVAGLIHSMAPQAQLHYQPVLDDKGVGDMSLLLLGLHRAIENKPQDEPRIVNLSLGFLPHPSRLPAAWYGLPRPHDPDYLYSDALSAGRDQRWVTTNRDEVDRTVHLLQVGLRELARYLRLNNCLVVAAAGNDSLMDVQTGHARMEPRLPARFESVLGVAATTSSPTQAAPYSNLGDERALGDHVATFGGSIDNRDEPSDGVIGVYAGDFPDQKPNETGWAYWSGTSFATGIVSGIAANVWGANPKLSAAEVLAEVHAAALDSGDFVAELRTPSIAVDAHWQT